MKAVDWHMLRAGPFLARLDGGLLTPRNKILGFDVAGRVEAVGGNAKQFHPGDDVFGNLFELRGGAFAEYVSVPERLLVLKPANLTFEAAAAVPMAAVTALRGLRDKGQIQPGQKVLSNGASGGVGTFAVQLARSFRVEVTAVCSPQTADLARSLGTDHVIDYTQADFTKGGQVYDVIIDVVGKGSFSRSLASLTENGRYFLGNAGLSQTFRTRWTSTGSKQVILGTGSQNAEDLLFLKDLIEAGKLKPFIDRRYPLEQMAEAHRYVDTGRKKGNVVVTVEHNN